MTCAALNHSELVKESAPPPVVVAQREIITAALAASRNPHAPVNLAAAEDPATDYARAVVDGEIIAGEPVRLACQRHMIDIYRTDLVWDAAAGDRFEKFCEKFAVIRNPITGERRPFILLPWQRFIGRSLFCWKVKEGDCLYRLAGTRRFRKLYLEGAKGNGKTPFTSAVSLHFLMVEPEWDFEGYIGGAKTDQAFIALEDMSDFLDHMRDEKLLNGLYDAKEMGGRGKKINPPAAVVYKTKDRVSEIQYYDRSGRKKGFIKAAGISGRGTGMSGFRPMLGYIIELHEVLSPELLNMLEQGSKGKPEPLILIDTNSGKDRQGICYDERSKVMSMLRRDHDDDALLGLIFCVDDGDDPWKDEACWYKANPSLESGEVIRKDYIQSKIVSARTPFEVAQVKRLNFGIWTEALALPFHAKDWDRCQVPKLEVPEGCPLFMGLDLANLQDMTALAWVWLECKRGLLPKFHGRVDYWWNRVALDRKPKERKAWLAGMVEEGWINLDEGNTNDMAAVADVLKANQKNIKGLAFDPWKLSELRLHMDQNKVRYYQPLREDSRVGIPFWRHPQGSAQERGERASPLWMTRSIQHITDALTDKLENRIVIENNPVLTWNTGTARMKQDHLGNVYLSRDSTGPGADNIDGLVALVMAVGLAAFSLEGLLDEGDGGLSSALLEYR